MAAQIFGSKLVGTFLLCLLFSKISRFECTSDTLSDALGGGKQYLAIMVAAYKTEIEKLVSKIAQTELTFNKRLALLEMNEELSSLIQEKAAARLRARGSLNLIGKMCIQNLDAKVTTENSALQSKLRACVDAARKGAVTFSAGAKKQEVHAREQLGFAVNDLPVCQKDAGNNGQKYAECVWNKWKPRESTTANHLKLGNKEIEDAVPKYDALVKVAQECSFKHNLDAHILMVQLYSGFNICLGDKTINV